VPDLKSEINKSDNSFLPDRKLRGVYFLEKLSFKIIFSVARSNVLFLGFGSLNWGK